MRWWLIKARKDRGLTQKEFCERVNIPQPLYSLYETGKICPRFKNAKRIADALDTDWMFFFNEPTVSFNDSTAR